MREDAPADAITRLDHRNARASPFGLYCRRQPCRTRANNGDVERSFIRCPPG